MAYGSCFVKRLLRTSMWYLAVILLFYSFATTSGKPLILSEQCVPAYSYYISLSTDLLLRRAQAISDVFCSATCIYIDSFDVYECLLAEKVAKPFDSNRQRKCMVQNFYVEVVRWL